MQAASKEYIALMKEKFINPLSYIRVTIGMINQQAQASAYVPDPENYTYYSSLKMPLDNYQVQELYASCDQNYTKADGSMYFMPRNRADVVLNQGIVSEEICGTVEILFPVPYDIKGLTVEFGDAYPTEFTIESNNHTLEISDNGSGHFVTAEIFSETTFLKIIPKEFVNGKSRLRIHQITMGIGIYFDNRQITSATKKEYISPISDELPTIDFDMTINNKDRAYDIENKTSSIHYLEVGQNVNVIFGQDLESGTTEWMPGASLKLKEWSADDDKMQFSATDRFDSELDTTYYNGKYYKNGISLYDLAVDVFRVSEVDSRTYWIDQYLQDVIIQNPMPAVTCKEALQLIANAGRCILYQDRAGNIYLKSNFIPDRSASAIDGTDYSHVENILIPGKKEEYASYAKDFTRANGKLYFLGDNVPYLNTGYVSGCMSGEDGFFTDNPTVSIQLEASHTCFGIWLEFGGNPPQELILHTSLFGVAAEDIVIKDISAVTVISREFKIFTRLDIEFIRTIPHNRILLDYVGFGEVTDYHLEYGSELLKTPKGTQLAKVRELQVVRTLYQESGEAKELIQEVVLITPAENQYTFYFMSPSYGLQAAILDSVQGQVAKIIKSSAYYAVVEVTGVDGYVPISVSGYEYTVTQARVCRRIHPTGKREEFENPLVSSEKHAADLAEWIGDYLKSDREYDLEYRGEPRLDANDLAYLENKYVEDMLVRIYDHTLKFSGAFSGRLKARCFDVDGT